MVKCVLLNSGGIDSRVCAAILKDGACWETHSLFIDWNVRARPMANDCAKATANLYCDSHVEFSYPVDWACLNEAQGKWTTQYATMTSTMLGLQYARKIGASYVINGTRMELTGEPEWPVRLNGVISANRIQGDRIVSFPIYDLTNDEVTEKAKSLGVDIATTWSCSQYPACGACSSCRRRKEQGL